MSYISSERVFTPWLKNHAFLIKTSHISLGQHHRLVLSKIRKRLCLACPGEVEVKDREGITWKE